MADGSDQVENATEAEHPSEEQVNEAVIEGYEEFGQVRAEGTESEELNQVESDEVLGQNQASEAANTVITTMTPEEVATVID